MTLAIAAPSFSRPSETFIHNHAKLLAPLSSALVCWDRHGAAKYGYPVFEAEIPSGRKIDIYRKLLAPFDQVLASTEPSDYCTPPRRDLRRLVQFLNEQNVQVMLAEYAPTALKFLDPCRTLKIPLFVHFHGWDANILGGSPIMRSRYRRLFKDVAGVIVTTKFLEGRVLALGCPPKKIKVCPCGIDTEMFSPTAAPVREKRVLMVSRLIPWKGPILSLESFALAAEKHADAILEVVGEGPLRSAMEERALELGISGQVIFHGPRDHKFVRDLMGRSRVLIQHCIKLPGGSMESQGLSVLEAMSCGLPVIVTKHGAFTETVVEGVTGITVRENDTISMSTAIRQMLEDPGYADQLGAAGRKHVRENYEQRIVIDRLRNILRVKC